MRQCAAFHGVWAGTLSRLVNCDQGYVGRGRVLTEFSEAEEKRLLAHIVKLLKLGFGLTIYELMYMMQELMTELRAANPKRISCEFLLFSSISCFFSFKTNIF